MKNKANLSARLKTGQSQFSNRKTDDRRQKPALSEAEGAEYSPRSSVIRPRCSVRESQQKERSPGQNEESSIFLFRLKIGYNYRSQKTEYRRQKLVPAKAGNRIQETGDRRGIRK